MNIVDTMMQMDSISIGLWVTGGMMLFVFLGVRVAFAAALAGFLGLVWIFSIRMGFEKGFLVAMKMAGTIPHSKVSTLALSLIPTFILIGFLAYHAGLTKALFKAAKRWVGWLPGGMGVATVFSAAGLQQYPAHLLPLLPFLPVLQSLKCSNSATTNALPQEWLPQVERLHHLSHLLRSLLFTQSSWSRMWEHSLWPVSCPVVSQH